MQVTGTVADQVGVRPVRAEHHGQHRVAAELVERGPAADGADRIVPGFQAEVVLDAIAAEAVTARQRTPRLPHVAGNQRADGLSTDRAIRALDAGHQSLQHWNRLVHGGGDKLPHVGEEGQSDNQR